MKRETFSEARERIMGYVEERGDWCVVRIDRRTLKPLKTPYAWQQVDRLNVRRIWFRKQSIHCGYGTALGNARSVESDTRKVTSPEHFWLAVSLFFGGEAEAS